MIENMSVFVRRFFVEFDRCEALLRLSLAESAVRRSFVPSVVASWFISAVALEFLGKLLNPQGKPRPLQKVSLN